MLTRRSRHFTSLLVCLGLSAATVACEKVPLMAPTGSTIVLTVGATALPANGTVAILAQVLSAAGVPPHSGTEVTFTTTLGTIQPATASTDISGQVTVTFNAGASNGTATIGALSGGATTGSTGAVKIAIGTAAVSRVSIGAFPTAVPATGGSTTITAVVFDINGNVLPGAPVVFNTTAGSLSSSVVTSDPNGAAQTTLTTSQPATVTATVGVQTTTPPAPTTGTTPTTPTTPTGTGTATNSVNVTVSTAPTLVITPPTTAPVAGLPSSFTFVVTNVANGAVVRSVTVSWGDGQSQNLNAISGSAAVFHTYSSAGTYVINATMLDSAGNVTAVSSSVTVTPSPLPTVSVNVSTAGTLTAGSPVSFTIGVAAPASTTVQIRDVSINFGDGTAAVDLGAVTGTGISVQHSFPTTTLTATAYTVQVSVQDSLGNTTPAATVAFVQPQPPLAVSLSKQTQPSGGNTVYTITATVTPPSVTVSSYIWTLDGSQVQSGGNNILVETLPTGAAHIVAVQVLTTTGPSTSQSISLP